MNGKGEPKLAPTNSSSPNKQHPNGTSTLRPTPRASLKVLGETTSLKRFMKLPPPRWRIDGWLGENSLAVVYGRPGGGKSFLALDMSLCIAAGVDWHGHHVERGRAVYLFSEGHSGAPKRIDAWLSEHSLTPSQLDGWFLPVRSGVNLLDELEVARLIRDLKRVQPGVVVIDTLARSMPGADENGSRDMSIVLRACDRIVRQLEVAVILVHHQTKAQPVLRGHGSLEAAVDTSLHVARDGDKVKLTCKKQKDGPEAESCKFGLKPVNESCVLVSAGSDRAAVGDRATAALDALAATDGLTWTAWKTRSGMKKETFNRARSDLIEAGLVMKEGSKYCVVETEESHDPDSVSRDE